MNLSGAPGHIRGPCPRIGQHTRETLSELGYAAEAIDRLRADGVVTGP